MMRELRQVLAGYLRATEAAAATLPPGE
jgi:hypothetical protein